MVISKAPSRLSPKAKKTPAMNPLTQGFEPNCTTPNGPRMAVVDQAESREQHHDSQAEHHRVEHASRRSPAGSGRTTW